MMFDTSLHDLPSIDGFSKKKKKVSIEREAGKEQGIHIYTLLKKKQKKDILLILSIQPRIKINEMTILFYLL